MLWGTPLSDRFMVAMTVICGGILFMKSFYGKHIVVLDGAKGSFEICDLISCT